MLTSLLSSSTSYPGLERGLPIRELLYMSAFINKTFAWPVGQNRMAAITHGLLFMSSRLLRAALKDVPQQDLDGVPPQNTCRRHRSSEVKLVDKSARVLLSARHTRTIDR